MMMARTQPVSQQLTQWGVLVAVSLTLVGVMHSPMSSAEGYSNPNYHSQPKKGEPVTLPTYSSPARPTPAPRAEPKSETRSESTLQTYDASRETTTRDSGPSSHNFELGVNLEMPVGLGDAGASLNPKYGANVQFFFQPLIDSDFNNYISVGYDSFALKADSNIKLNLVPFTFGMEFARHEDKTFRPMFGIALGGAYAWLGMPDAQTVNGKAYFLAQIRPGLEVHLSGFSIMAQTPISILVGGTKMSYLAYSLGARFGI